MTSAAIPQATPAKRKQLYKSLYFQVICAILIGVLLGYFYPSRANR